MEKSIKLANQVAGTMAIEGMKLTKKEFNIVKQCAAGKKSSKLVINEMINKYKVK